MLPCNDALRRHIRFIPTCVGNISAQADATASTAGSSPRVWGTCIAIAPRPDRDTVHPHVCGEHVDPPRQQAEANGSSPRVWGTSSAGNPHVGRIRFIPTCVGNIPITTFGMFFPSVHPHVCGEHIACVEKWELSGGSSPRVWGTFEGHPES